MTIEKLIKQLQEPTKSEARLEEVTKGHEIADLWLDNFADDPFDVQILTQNFIRSNENFQVLHQLLWAHKIIESENPKLAWLFRLWIQGAAANERNAASDK